MIGLRRSRVAEEPRSPTETGVQLAFDVVVLLRDSLDGYRRILREFDQQGSSADLRAAALHLARRIAMYERSAMIFGEDLLSLPEDLSPNRGLVVLQHLGYSLVALGQEQPDARTLLAEADLEELLQQTDAQAWMEGALESIPDDWEAS
jgi:hypothetical protein